MKEDKFEEATLGIFAYDKDIIPYLNDNSDVIKVYILHKYL